MKIGVLAVQGSFIEHIEILQKLGVQALPVRMPSQLDGLDGLIIPGGESTTIVRLMTSYRLAQRIKEMAGLGLPIWGTCAGMVLLAKNIANYQMETLGLMDINVRRNAFGSQVDSFEVDLHIPVLGKQPFRGVFIRAPIVVDVAPGVEILSRLADGRIVAVRQHRLLACSFHPEFTDDFRFHSYFLAIIDEQASRQHEGNILRCSCPKS